MGLEDDIEDVEDLVFGEFRIMVIPMIDEVL